jgi:hypothetical protein
MAGLRGLAGRLAAVTGAAGGLRLYDQQQHDE